MSGIFTVLIALGLMQGAPDIDHIEDRREQTKYAPYVDPNAEAKARLTLHGQLMLQNSNPLPRAR